MKLRRGITARKFSFLPLTLIALLIAFAGARPAWAGDFSGTFAFLDNVPDESDYTTIGSLTFKKGAVSGVMNWLDPDDNEICLGLAISGSYTITDSATGTGSISVTISGWTKAAPCHVSLTSTTLNAVMQIASGGKTIYLGESDTPASGNFTHDINDYYPFSAVATHL